MGNWEDQFYMCAYCGVTYNINTEHNGEENSLTKKYCRKCIGKAREDLLNSSRDE